MNGIGSRVPGWRWAALSVVAAVAAAVTGMSAGVATASAAPRLAPRAGLSLAQAPAGLRAAVARTLGAPAAGKRWPQQAELTGSDVAAGDYFSWSVAVSGTTAVVGAPALYKDDGRGAVYVFVRTGKTWSQQAKLTASDAATGDRFGQAVAVSRTTVVVGAPGKNSFTGAAYVFRRTGKTWSQQAKLTASDAAASDFFGWSVAVSGTTAVVGAPGKNDFSGAAYVFVRTGMRWSQRAELTAANGAEFDSFGASVAISGTTALVGAYHGNNGTGAAYVFVRTGRAWSQRADLTASDAAQPDYFGYSVAISGTTAVVGAIFANHFAGAAYVFVRSGRAWSQRAELTVPGTAPDSEFGGSVAVSGKTALVGVRGTDLAATAYVFVRTGRAWPQQAELTPANRTGIPSPVAISGKTAVVGAVNQTGAAYVFVRTGRPGHGSRR